MPSWVEQLRARVAQGDIPTFSMYPPIVVNSTPMNTGTIVPVPSKPTFAGTIVPPKRTRKPTLAKAANGGNDGYRN